MRIQKLDGYDYNYAISDFGIIYKDGRALSPADNGLGYKDIKLLKNHRRIHHYVHRLVWETFIGPIPKGMEINHIDHNKSNNRLDNLELVSHSDNLKKAVAKYGKFGFLQ